MPLLPSEPFCFPAELFDLPDQTNGPVWWVLHTKPRTEKAVARSLCKDSVDFFLPVYEQSRKVRSRVLKSFIPLFPSYVFIRAGEEGRLRALETNQIAHCIPVKDQEQLRGELEAVYRVMTSGAPVGPHARLVQGTPVTIAKGPLQGLKGKVLQRKNQLTLVIEVLMLSQAVSVEIEGWMIEAIPPDAIVSDE